MRQGAVSLTDPAHTHGGPCRRVLHLAPRPRAHTVLRFVMNIAGPPLVLPSPALLEKCPWKCRASTSITIVETTMFMSEWWWVSLTGHSMVWSCSSSCLSRASTSERGHSSPTPLSPEGPLVRRRTTATSMVVLFRSSCVCAVGASARLRGDQYTSQWRKL